MKQAGLTNFYSYIPLGIDTSVFKPLNKSDCKKIWKIPEDYFIIGLVGGNYEREMRKRWDKNLEAIKIFKEQNPDAKFKIFIHSDVKDTHHGVDILGIIKFLDLEQEALISDPYFFRVPLLYNKMPTIYNCFDIYMNLSSREGFGLCALEAQACGIPAIQTDFSSMTELTHPDLRVKVQAKIMTPLISWTAIPDAWDAAQKIEMLWKSPTKLKKYSKWSLEFARKYDWNGELVKGRWKITLEKAEKELGK